MKRYQTIDWINGSKIIDYNEPTTEYDDSLTDKTHFIPTQEAVKRLANQPPMSSDQINQSYDFPDGKDNGVTIPTGRKLGRDLAEISTEINNQNALIKDQLIEGKKKADLAMTIDNAINSVATPTSNQSQT
jgi:hypothetical protein